ncbi:ABC transporter ATP-binding protein [Corynebacterium uberis]|uniref:ABC transporter ATP-binding protein n=1 Tax=Corynebacterium TaxID=1716 RepID=UPI001D09C5A2|nr:MULTISPECIES: ATP-binding cassette domain-containing protein [Corynebacterium]MCZ9310291.1 ATP-binding cassette domain-containing protein [Corynebacterium sp. c6VSa_13]UDL73640.1 ATP-binding cassette domain-containing protein [Corynebacterium uberis]UDL75480.1 ATP-binding cassette domain-containing protein [Corynebacterium uberis]UDL77693.1 ATP-binding cassette domain-containing protein [Corynebacterium uberis]UDL79977.1 ATP-binding cassette domain-containing protein [Corynebacterium uberis
MPEVELRHVACAPALADVSVELAPGVCALVGRNAAGKSTLLRIIAGLRRPDSGTVRVRGAIGCVLDGVGAHPSHSVTRHLRWVGALGGVDKRRVAEVLEWSGLADVAHAQVRTLSTGLRARLDVAAAALTDPPILLLDEPLNGMDVAAVWWMREVLATWREEGKIVIMATHALAEVERTCDRALLVDAGRIRDVDCAAVESALREVWNRDER